VRFPATLKGLPAMDETRSGAVRMQKTGF